MFVLFAEDLIEIWNLQELSDKLNMTEASILDIKSICISAHVKKKPITHNYVQGCLGKELEAIFKQTFSIKSLLQRIALYMKLCFDHSGLSLSYTCIAWILECTLLDISMYLWSMNYELSNHATILFFFHTILISMKNLCLLLFQQHGRVQRGSLRIILV